MRSTSVFNCRCSLIPFDLFMPNPRPSFRSRPIRTWLQDLEAEKADREAWLAGVQKRLGLITTGNLLELEIIKDRRLGNA